MGTRSLGVRTLGTISMELGLWSRKAEACELDFRSVTDFKVKLKTAKFKM